MSGPLRGDFFLTHTVCKINNIYNKLFLYIQTLAKIY